jgi:hypothetical protein
MNTDTVAELRKKADVGSEWFGGNEALMLRAATEIEHLRATNAALLRAKQVTIVSPPLPETQVTEALRATVREWASAFHNERSAVIALRSDLADARAMLQGKDDAIAELEGELRDTIAATATQTATKEEVTP